MNVAWRMPSPSRSSARLALSIRRSAFARQQDKSTTCFRSLPSASKTGSALVTTFTQRMAEELAGYINEMGIKAHYLHAEIETLERIEILRDLRLGVYDVIVGINLLREGIDLPEVSLVVILDADKEGFLRSEQALIQNIGARRVMSRDRSSCMPTT